MVIACPNGVIGPNDHSAFGYFLRLHLNHLMVPFAWAAHSTLSLVHVDDLAEGLALAAEKGRIGETYFLAGEAISRREMLKLWATKPGGFTVRFYLPAWLAAIFFAPVAPVLRLMGLPAFISLETVNSAIYHITSSQKAQSELGWIHRSAQEAWLDVLDAEIELKKQRTRRGIRSRLMPLP